MPTIRGLKINGVEYDFVHGQISGNVENSLTSTSTTDALSALQGSLLNEKCRKEIWTLISSGSVSTATSSEYVYHTVTLSAGVNYKVVVTLPEYSGVTTVIAVNNSSTVRVRLATDQALDGAEHTYTTTLSAAANRVVFGPFDGTNYGTIKVKVYRYDGEASAIDLIDNLTALVATKANKITVDVTSVIGRLITNSTSNATISNDATNPREGVVTIVTPAIYKRFGYYIGNVPRGYTFRVSFKLLYTGTGYTSCQYSVAGGTINSQQSGANVPGNVTIVGNESPVQMNYTLNSATGTYIQFGTRYLVAGDTITISDFSAEMDIDIDYLYERITTMKSEVSAELQADPAVVAPSSTLPPIYGYERYMTIQGTQAAGTCGDYLAVAYNKTINLYNMATKELVQSQITMPSFNPSNSHYNTVNFGVEKYDSSDVFPLLYLSSGYQDSNGIPRFFVCRLVGSLGSMTMSLVQTITVDPNFTTTWTEGIVDTENNRLWVKYASCSYICWELPLLSAGDVTLYEATAIEAFELKPIPHAFGTSAASYQGHCFKQGKIWCTVGVPSWTDETDENTKIIVVDTHNKCRCAITSLSDMGLKNNNTNTYEPESVFFWNNDLYVGYRTFVAKIVKLSTY